MTFTPEVYALIREGAQRSAAAVVPLIYEDFKPDSVMDFGCGEGWWSREFARQGCEVVAMDSTVETKHEEDGVVFCRRDLETAPALGSPDAGPGDLAISLEVAEHLSQAAGERLVESLVHNGRVVVFSAAVPGQGGHGHLNEQWPAYWAKLFEQHGYAGTDYLRWLLWNDDTVEPWYRQNLIVFAQVEILCDRLVRREWSLGAPAVVHPVIWEHRRQRP